MRVRETGDEIAHVADEVIAGGKATRLAVDENAAVLVQLVEHGALVDGVSEVTHVEDLARAKSLVVVMRLADHRNAFRIFLHHQICIADAQSKSMRPVSFSKTVDDNLTVKNHEKDMK